MMSNCSWIGFGGWIFSFLFFGFGLLGAFILLYKDITLAPKYKNIYNSLTPRHLKKNMLNL
jgi:hypothetical protein